MFRAVALMVCVGTASGRFLMAPTRKLAGARDNGTAMSTRNSTVTTDTDAQKLGKLQDGLNAITNLRTMFQADHKSVDGNEFAEGALSSELANQSSDIWGTLQTMISAATQAKSALKSKDKAAQQKVMASLERDLDEKAEKLHTGLDKVSVHQQQLDDEYVLGLLNMHKDWTMDQQLNATKQFMEHSPKLQELYYHHDLNQSLVLQLAALMDTDRPTVRKATSLFLQLASSFKLW